MGFYSRKDKKKKHSNKNIIPHGTVTMLSKGTTVEGVVRLATDVRIDGVVNGNVESDNRVVIGESGKIIGNIQCGFLELHGSIEGDVKSEQGARLHQTATLKGDLHAPEFSIDMGAKFIGASKGQQMILPQEDLKKEKQKNK